jgi:dTMP kinase
MDDYQLELHQRVRRGYLELAAAEPGRWVVIDASQPGDMVQSSIRRAVDRVLPVKPIP